MDKTREMVERRQAAMLRLAKGRAFESQVSRSSCATHHAVGPGPPPQLTSEIWARDYNEIKDLGGNKSTAPTPAQTEAGRFWIMVGPASWAPIVRQLAATPGRTLLQNARLFALTEMAAADSYIAVLDAKNTYNFWRPITAIRNGDLDGNDETTRVSDWEPLIDTPLHPEYPCAHCINSMAVATVLESEFGNGRTLALSMTSSTAPGVVHKWASFEEWTDELQPPESTPAFIIETPRW